MIIIFLVGTITVNAGYWQDYFEGQELVPTAYCGSSASGSFGLVEWKDLKQEYIIETGGGCGYSTYQFIPDWKTDNLIFQDVENVKVTSSNSSVVTAKVKPYDFHLEKENYEHYIDWYNKLTEEEWENINHDGYYETKPTWWEFSDYETEPKTWWEAYGLSSEPKNAVEIVSYGHDLGTAKLTVSADNKEDITIEWLVQAYDFGTTYSSFDTPKNRVEGLVEILNNLEKYKEVIPQRTSWSESSGKQYNFEYYMSAYDEDIEDLSTLINTLKGKDITIHFYIESANKDNYYSLNSMGMIDFFLNGQEIENTANQGLTYYHEISFKDSIKKKQIDALVTANDKIYIDFKYQGKLPTKVPFTIFLEDAYRGYYFNENNYCEEGTETEKSSCLQKVNQQAKEKANKEYTLLAYNPTTRKMEVIQEHLKATSKDEWSYAELTITLDSLAYYVLVPTEEYTLNNDVDVMDNYLIHYELNGGSNNASNPSTYEENNKEIVLKNPTRTGYTFQGWYSDSKYTKKVTSIKANSKGDITLYAKWSINTYTIKYNANGGTGKMSNTNVKYGSSVTFTNKFTRTGYTFTGWNTKADGTGISYTNKQVIDRWLTTKTITLYAQWKKNTYTITYQVGSGTNSKSNPATYTVTTSTITLKSPTAKGYTFKGWYSDSKYKTKVTTIKKGSTGNKTLYAKWSANTYTVKYNANGGTGKMSNTSVKYNKTATLTANKFTRKGYTFTGWNTKADGTGTSYTNKQSIKNLTSKNKGTVTLYAQWKKNTYTIKYNLNGGNAVSNPTTYTVTTKTITLKSPKRTGYTFQGWYSDSKYKTKVTSIKKGSTGNKTLYAKWSANTYTVKYNANGGTGRMSNTSVKYNKTATLTANKFKRTGYTFIGWNTKKDGTGTTYTNKQSIKNLTTKNKATITLYAQWKKNTYTITYKVGSGINSSSNPATYTVTTSTITLKNPTAPGYTFKGWYSDSKYKTKVTTIKKGSTGNKTLYAKWAANSYTIKYNANGGTGKMSNVAAKYNKSVTLTANKFKRTNYTFTGWNTKADGTGTSYTNQQVVKGLTTKNNGTVTLYAQWELTKTLQAKAVEAFAKAIHDAVARIMYDVNYGGGDVAISVETFTVSAQDAAGTGYITTTPEYSGPTVRCTSIEYNDGFLKLTGCSVGGSQTIFRYNDDPNAQDTTNGLAVEETAE